MGTTESERILNPPTEFSREAHVRSLDEYRQVYDSSVRDPQTFWAERAEGLTWFKKWDNIYSWDAENAVCKWFEGGKLNAAYNCLDRYLPLQSEKIAVLWENEIGDTESYTYRQLYLEVCRLANVLRKRGIKKGDKVAIYMPIVPQLAIAMLACARVGAVHNVIFTGFGPDAIRYRIRDSICKMVITADSALRAGKTLPVKENIDRALNGTVESVLVYDRTNAPISIKEGRDFIWQEEAEDAGGKCEPEAMDAEDPLFVLYTSGSTGEPEGMLHTTGGYLLYAMQTSKWMFDFRDKDIHWCTADIGWIEGHSYAAYGPLACGATVFMYEGAPTYPEPDRFWELIEKYRITTFYTSPAVVRALRSWGDELPGARDLSSLRLLAVSGEQIDPEDCMWLYSVGEKCPVADAWLQTETGGILLSPFPGATPLKPGSVALPLPGIEPAVLKPDGAEAGTDEEGELVIKNPWPGMMRTIYGNHTKFKEMYFARYPGMYRTGDRARRDRDGYFWLAGRIDEVIKVSGYRLGPREIERALASHPAVAEATAVGYPSRIKGESLYAFVALKRGMDRSSARRDELKDRVRNTVGGIAVPEKLQFVDALPRTSSGEVARWVLKKIASGDIAKLDASSLANPSVVEELVRGRE